MIEMNNSEVTCISGGNPAESKTELCNALCYKDYQAILKREDCFNGCSSLWENGRQFSVWFMKTVVAITIPSEVIMGYVMYKIYKCIEGRPVHVHHN